MLFFLLAGILIFTISFVSKRKHLLATLLSLEGLMLFILCLIYFSSSSFHEMFNFNLVFITLTACEGALGLSLLVTIVRSHGGDQFNSLNFLQC
uniref:NADH-ubiquinone oxidoreductase chain 4L n=1 Tax=Simocephalus sibiricus TaxID=1472266 RepID=A0A8E6WX02_9CRUS|nr:NADH dehydrogenase subunit 4L [Simocephalus sibiricus]